MKKLFTSFIIITSLLFTSCYSWFQKEIPMDLDTPQTNLESFFYQKPVITALSAPVELFASKGEFSKSIKLTCSKVEHASTYRIERAIVKPDEDGVYALPEDGDFEYLDNIIADPNEKEIHYEDKILKNNFAAQSNLEEYSNFYYYRISAENVFKGLDSSEFTEISDNSKGWLLSPPKNVTATKGQSTEGINIEWNTVQKAIAYEIYRYENSEENRYQKLYSVSANSTSFFDTLKASDKGKDFYYEVVAVMQNNSKSAYSDRILGFSLVEGAPQPPQSISIKNGKAESIEGFTIEWNEIQSTTPETYPNISYNLYRSSSASSVQKLIKSNIKDTKYTDNEDLKPGILYYYYLQSIASNNSDPNDTLKSAFSEQSEETTAYLLSPPTTIDIDNTEVSNQIILKWKPAIGETDGNPFEYIIFYSNSQFEGYIELTNSKAGPKDSQGYYNLRVEKYPFYKIVTINAGKTSKDSIIVAPTPNAPTSVKASKTSALGGISAYSPNNNNVYPVQITWSKPDNDTPFGYNIYRSTKPDSSFRKINDEIISNTTFSFIDENETARAGSIYYYKVVSINSLGQGKKSNNPADGNKDYYGYGALTPEQWFREYNKTVLKSQSRLTLMHKSNDMDKLGSESVNGAISGSLSYNAKIAGAGANITMHYENYCEFYINNDSKFGPYFVLTGNTDTSANMSANGSMSGRPICTGMYPGYAEYGKLQIKSGGAGGGSYGVQTKDLNGNIIFNHTEVDWKLGEEGK